MRPWTAAILITLAAALGTAETNPCQAMALNWQQLQKEYKFAEMEALADQAVKQCSMESNFEVFHQAAMTYLWRGELAKAQPIVKALSERAEKNVLSSPGAAALGPSNYLPLLYAIYSGATDRVEEALVGYDQFMFKSQEAVMTYLLRNNDKRFPKFYQERKPIKREYSPILCRVYCKRNAMVKDCPCANDALLAVQGGPYAIYTDYLNGKPLDELKKEIEERYGQAPLLKKEIQQCLGL
jgi:hypothetical protein